MSNTPRTGVVRSVLAQGALAALIVVTLGCGDSSPAGPTATPVTPAPAAPALVYTVTASTNMVAPGGQLSVSWVAPSGRGCIGGGDWIAIFGVGDPDVTGAANGHSDLWFTHVCGATSGTAMASAPTQPGQYEFRYMIGDTSVARSSPVTVEAAGGEQP